MRFNVRVELLDMSGRSTAVSPVLRLRIVCVLGAVTAYAARFPTSV